MTDSQKVKPIGRGASQCVTALGGDHQDARLSLHGLR
jgi:hypothetical protein